MAKRTAKIGPNTLDTPISKKGAGALRAGLFARKGPGMTAGQKSSKTRAMNKRAASGQKNVYRKASTSTKKMFKAPLAKQGRGPRTWYDPRIRSMRYANKTRSDAIRAGLRRAGRKGKPLSTDHKKKIGAAIKDRWEASRNDPNSGYGKMLSQGKAYKKEQPISATRAKSLHESMKPPKPVSVTQKKEKANATKASTKTKTAGAGASAPA